MIEEDPGRDGRLVASSLASTLIMLPGGNAHDGVNACLAHLDPADRKPQKTIIFTKPALYSI